MEPLISPFGLLVTSALGFKASDSLVCMLYHLCAMDSSDSPDDLLTASMVAKPLRSTYLHIYLISIGGA